MFEGLGFSDAGVISSFLATLFKYTFFRLGALVLYCKDSSCCEIIKVISYIPMNLI